MTFRQDAQRFIASLVDKSPYGIFTDRLQLQFERRFFAQVLNPFEIDFSRYYSGHCPEMEAICLNPTLMGIFLYRISRVFYMEKDEDGLWVIVRWYELNS